MTRKEAHALELLAKAADHAARLLSQGLPALFVHAQIIGLVRSLGDTITDADAVAICASLERELDAIERSKKTTALMH